MRESAHDIMPLVGIPVCLACHKMMIFCNAAVTLYCDQAGVCIALKKNRKYEYTQVIVENC